MNVRMGQWAWFVLADNHRAKLLRCTATPTGKCHIELQDATEQKWEGHEHGRPSRLAGKTGHSYAAGHHDVEEDELRFTRQLVGWLEGAVGDHRIGRLTVYVPPRMLGLLRGACTGRLSGVVDLHEADLINLPNDALHKHPSVLRLIG